MREGEGLGAVTAVGRALRTSRSSKSDMASEMSPSDGSESDTSSMRACDIVPVWVVFLVILEKLWRGSKLVGHSCELSLAFLGICGT